MPNVVLKSLITRDFLLCEELEKIFSLSFPRRQGKIEGGATRTRNLLSLPALWITTGRGVNRAAPFQQFETGLDRSRDRLRSRPGARIAARARAALLLHHRPACQRRPD